MTPRNTPTDPTATPSSPHTDRVFIACSCVVVGVAAFLGLAWLRHPVLGMPFGLWLVMAEYGLFRLWRRRQAAAISAVAGAAGSQRGAFDTGHVEQLSFEFRSSSSAAGYDTEPNYIASRHSAVSRAAIDIPEVSGAQQALLAGASSLARMSVPLLGSRQAARLSNWHDARSWPSRPICIGVSLPAPLADQLMRCGKGPVHWQALDADNDPERLATSGRFDAVVWRDSEGRILAAMPERPDRDAAWYDWAITPPFSYASVFPPRIDPARITLPALDNAHPDVIALAGTLVEAAAVLSRTAARLSLADRLGGRRPLECGPAVSARLASALALIERGHAGENEQVHRIAARVASAFLAASDALIDPATRRAGVETALGILGEPEVALRAVAACFACDDDERGMHAVTIADRAIRAAGIEATSDPLKFLHSEMEHGLAGPITFGRIAAGVALLCSTTPDEQLEYVKEDLREDLRFSSLFIGRDADLLTLLRIVRTVEAERRGRAKAA